MFFWNSRPDAAAEPPRAVGSTQFQSLFFWNSRPDFKRKPSLSEIVEFQSLFFWNSRPDLKERVQSSTFTGVSILVFLELAPGPTMPALYLNSTSCFNPCFSGTRARTHLGDFGTWRDVSFNPCFSGTRARTLLCWPGVSPRPSFNPCFSGTRARTMERETSNIGTRVSILVFLELAPGLEDVAAPNRRPSMFQSLFFWNSRPDVGPDPPIPDRSEVFQSLFFWNSRPDSSSSVLPDNEQTSFNPCFSGTRART